MMMLTMVVVVMMKSIEMLLSVAIELETIMRTMTSTR
jgi:hypothetical protein